MWPWGHLAFGYLIYAFGLAAWRRRPETWPVVALAVGTQFPDVVDKPLAYWTGLIPAGRSLTHSLIVFIPLGLVVVAVAWHYRRGVEGVAFTVGWGSHLIADSLKALWQGTYGQLSFLVWPLLPLPAYGEADFHVHLHQLIWLVNNLDATALLHPGADIFVFQLWLFAFVMLLWIVQGMPPVAAAWRWGKREYGPVRRR